MLSRKVYESPATAVADIADGATILIGSGGPGAPDGLLAALALTNARQLTCIGDFKDAADPDHSIGQLLRSGRIAKIIAPTPCPLAEEAANCVQEIIPQATLSERLRAAGAGIGGVFLPVGPNGQLPEGQEVRMVNGRECALEMPLRADYALLAADVGDTLGNLIYAGPQRGWNAVMAPAARIAIAEVAQLGEPGIIDPELVITPGIFINRVVVAAPKAGG